MIWLVTVTVVSVLVAVGAATVGAASITGAASVVVVNTSDTPPIVRVVFVAVELLADEVCRTRTVCPLVTVPAAAVHAPPLMEYSPPADTDMALAILIHDTVIGADSMGVESATLVWSTNVKASGMASRAAGAILVTLSDLTFTDPFSISRVTTVCPPPTSLMVTTYVSITPTAGSRRRAVLIMS